MRIALLHAPGDESIAEDIARGGTFGDAFVAPLSPGLAYGAHFVLLVLWTERATPLAAFVSQLTQARGGVVVWRLDGAPAPRDLGLASILGPDSTPASIATALRLEQIDAARERNEPAPRRRSSRRLATAVLGAGMLAALGAAGAAAVMLEQDSPGLLAAVRTPPPRPPIQDIRTTSPVEPQSQPAP